MGTAPAAPCTEDLRSAAAPAPWDVLPNSPTPTFTTNGNNADVALSRWSPLTPGPDRGVRPTSNTREYSAPWTNAWRTSRCNSANFAGGIVPATGPDTFAGTNANDVNAAIINLFATLNRLHDWTYLLGFKETTYNFQVGNFGKGGAQADPVLGDAQGGPISSEGGASYLGDVPATPADGIASTLDTFLWQPVAATFYGPCVDGSFDASVIAHRYAQLMVDRMAAGPTNGIRETSSVDGQAAAIREGWGDLIATEFLRATAEKSSSVVGAYVSGNAGRGLRTYAMSDSPLNYSNVRGWDGNGAGSASDDGEIWAAVNFELREAIGSTRLLEILFASLSGLSADATMIRARDEMLEHARAAERTAIWRAFARRGLGERASGTVDTFQPRPSFETPRETNEATVSFRFRASDEGGRAVRGKVFVGAYEAGVTPIADTSSATSLPSREKFVPGSYRFVFQAAGYGAVKKTLAFRAGQNRLVTVSMPTNRASKSKGAAAAGASTLIDDTEATNWTEQADTSVDEAGLSVTVDLAGTKPVTVDRLQVSALLRQSSPEQNRFTALRAFELFTCTRTATRSCSTDGHFTQLGGTYEPFAAGAPRPVPADLSLRAINVTDRKATHVRMVVLENQCTGTPEYRGEDALEQDPLHVADCVEGAPAVAKMVRAAELQVFSRAPAVSNAAAG